MSTKDKQIEDILERAKNDEGTNYYGINYYRGRYFATSIGAVKKLSRKEAAEIVKENL